MRKKDTDPGPDWSGGLDLRKIKLLAADFADCADNIEEERTHHEGTKNTKRRKA